MSLITVQLGQCGNQIGGQFYSTILQDIQSKKTQVSSRANDAYVEESIERFFVKTYVKGRDEEILEARSVMVDMEPKVIAQTCQQAKRSGQWRYPVGQFFCQKRGSGNNWANGFCFYGSQAENAVMDMIQKEAEKCDHLGGFIILMSVAGGTGSGWAPTSLVAFGMPTRMHLSLIKLSGHIGQAKSSYKITTPY